MPGIEVDDLYENLTPDVKSIPWVRILIRDGCRARSTGRYRARGPGRVTGSKPPMGAGLEVLIPEIKIDSREKSLIPGIEIDSRDTHPGSRARLEAGARPGPRARYPTNQQGTTHEPSMNHTGTTRTTREPAMHQP